MNSQLEKYLQQNFDLPETGGDMDDEAMMISLSGKINDLIQTDFERLVNLLYRIDVDEQKLKELLIDNPNEDAGVIIARLIIERQLQKIKFKEAFRNDESNIDEEEKW